MAKLRYGLIAVYGGCSLVGAWVAIYRQASMGLVKPTERRGSRKYGKPGITSVQELARYHDAAGRAAVLAVLRALPAGERSLLVAARNVEPDATWD